MMPSTVPSTPSHPISTAASSTPSNTTNKSSNHKSGNRKRKLIADNLTYNNTTSAAVSSESTNKHEHIIHNTTLDQLHVQLQNELIPLLHAYGDTDQPLKQSVDVVSHCIINIIYGCLNNSITLYNTNTQNTNADDVKIRLEQIVHNISLYPALQTHNHIKNIQNDNKK